MIPIRIVILFIVTFIGCKIPTTRTTSSHPKEDQSDAQQNPASPAAPDPGTEENCTADQENSRLVNLLQEYQKV